MMTAAKASELAFIATQLAMEQGTRAAHERAALAHLRASELQSEKKAATHDGHVDFHSARAGAVGWKNWRGGWAPDLRLAF